MDDEYNDIFPINRTLIIDASSDFDEEPSDEELRDYINWYIKQNKVNIPEVSTTVNIVDLASTEEYKDFAPLETVQLCDSVSIFFPLFGIHTKEEITKIEFNVLTEKNNSVTIGETKMTLANVIANNKYNLRKNKYDTQSWADRMAERVTRASNGWYGGNSKKRYNSSDHKQQDLLIMDSDNESSASHVLKANGSGISGSTSGSNGTYNALIALRNPRNEIGVNGTAVNFGRLRTQDSVASNRQSYLDLDTGEGELVVNTMVVGTATKDGLENGDAKITGKLLLGDINVAETLGGVGAGFEAINAALQNLDARVTALGG